MSSLADFRQLSRLTQAAMPSLIVICLALLWAVLLSCKFKLHNYYSLAQMFLIRQSPYANLSTLDAPFALTHWSIHKPALSFMKTRKWSYACHDLALTLIAMQISIIMLRGRWFTSEVNYRPWPLRRDCTSTYACMHACKSSMHADSVLFYFVFRGRVALSGEIFKLTIIVETDFTISS